MPSRSFWRGYLKLSLVTCPVAMTPATTEGEKIRFHTLNRETGNRIESRYVDAETEEPVEPEDEVKGYQRGDDDYVMIEDEDLEAVALDSTRTIDIDMFVPAASIGWIWYDKPHYLVPNDAVGEEAYAVIREAMASTKTVGIARLVLYRRERAVMLQPRDNGIVLWTLRFGDEVREAPDNFHAEAGGKPETEAKTLIKTLIKKRTRAWDPKDLVDPVQDRLQEIIAAKGKPKQAAKKKTEPARPTNVVNIMDALRNSLAAEKSGKGRARKPAND